MLTQVQTEGWDLARADRARCLRSCRWQALRRGGAGNSKKRGKCTAKGRPLRGLEFMSELKLFCIRTSVTPCIRTSVTLFRSVLVLCWEGSEGARRATGEPSQRRAAGPALACILGDDRSPARTRAGSSPATALPVF